MKYHIVQVNEKIQDISRKYHVSVDEIVKLNRHISNIDYIVPGMKIRLPVLSDEVSDELKDNFLDIEKYYPKVDDFKEVQIGKKYDETISDEEDIPSETNQNSNDNFNKQYQYPYQYQQPINQYQQNYIPNTQYQYIPYQSIPYQNQYPNYYQQPQVFPRVTPIEPISAQIPQNATDLTLPQYRNINLAVEPKYFDQPAYCDPILYGGVMHKMVKKEKNNFIFQNPLFTPPYPCGKPIEDCQVNENIKIDENMIKYDDYNKPEIVELDEEVNPVKVDLREYVKKHTKIKKK